jgi:2'-hydroxyisoflavone reductase
MRLLVVGGTRFLGRHLVQQALDAGHEVTLLHRGQSGASLFPQAEHRIADRNGDLGLLAGGTWDAVIDTCAYVPRQVRAMAAALRGRVGHYQLVSTISVYAHFAPHGTAEDAPLASLDDEHTEVVDGQTYGGLKALCERALLDALPEHACIVRPGLLVGPHDPTGRFTWWVQRFLRGGAVLCPGAPAAPLQFIDARDAAAFVLQQAQVAHGGVFNLTGPPAPLTMGAFFDAARRTLNPSATPRWIDEALLLAAGVTPWTELPLWVPAAEAGLHAVSIERARAGGLRCRPLEDTLRDTAAWIARDGAPNAATGLSPEREAALLAAVP